MSEKKEREIYMANFKVKVELEAPKGVKAIRKISQKYGGMLSPPRTAYFVVNSDNVIIEKPALSVNCRPTSGRASTVL